jgi:phytoene/squalene synthetase
MKPSLASQLTKAASKQTYYTIRFLVDRPRREDAYRAYAYFRWVDDVLDAEGPRGAASAVVGRLERQRFLDRQRTLLDRTLRGEAPRDIDPHEAMLVELVRNAESTDRGLEAYLRHMMLVMDFDVRRRGRIVSQAQLDDYTRWLAIAVTEAMHHFIGHGAAAPHDETRYLAVSGAHILHMLRDTYADARAGYFNVPRELLEAQSIAPEDFHSDAYRAWAAASSWPAPIWMGAWRTSPESRTRVTASPVSPTSPGSSGLQKRSNGTTSGFALGTENEPASRPDCG